MPRKSRGSYREGLQKLVLAQTHILQEEPTMTHHQNKGKWKVDSSKPSQSESTCPQVLKVKRGVTEDTKEELEGHRELVGFWATVRVHRIN